MEIVVAILLVAFIATVVYRRRELKRMQKSYAEFVAKYRESIKMHEKMAKYYWSAGDQAMALYHQRKLKELRGEWVSTAATAGNRRPRT